VLCEFMLRGRTGTQDSFIYVSLGLMMLVLNSILGNSRRRRGQRQQRTVSVVRCNVGWRSQVRFLTACVIARRVWALVGVQW
jgi:LPXTG-motif cell wall-anchored protein